MESCDHGAFLEYKDSCGLNECILEEKHYHCKGCTWSTTGVNEIVDHLSGDCSLAVAQNETVVSVGLEEEVSSVERRPQRRAAQKAFRVWSGLAGHGQDDTTTIDLPVLTPDEMANGKDSSSDNHKSPAQTGGASKKKKGKTPVRVPSPPPPAPRTSRAQKQDLKSKTPSTQNATPPAGAKGKGKQLPRPRCPTCNRPRDLNLMLEDSKMTQADIKNDVEDTGMLTDECIAKHYPTLIPIPVPVYIPVPMRMYTEPVPCTLPTFIPIPIPILLPTTLNTTEKIAKLISQIINKVPLDPIEADILQMADAVSDAAKEVKTVKRYVMPSSRLHKNIPGKSVMQSGSVLPADRAGASSQAVSGCDMLMMAAEMATSANKRHDRVGGEGPPAKVARTDQEALLQSGGIVTDAESGQQMQLHVDESGNVVVTSVGGNTDPALLQAGGDGQGVVQLMSSGEEGSQAVMYTDEAGEGGVTHAYVILQSEDGEGQTGETVMLQGDQSAMGNDLAECNTVAQTETVQTTQQQQQSSEAVATESASGLNAAYGIDAFRQWVQNRAPQDDFYGGRKLNLKTDMLQMTYDEMDYFLSMFITEICQPNGEKFSADFILYLVLALQQYLYNNGRINNLLFDMFFQNFQRTLDLILSSYRPVVTNEGAILPTHITEEMMWECQQFGAHSPHVLLTTLMYFNTRYFRLKSPGEHFDLTFANVVKYCKRTAKGPGEIIRQEVFIRYFVPFNKKEKSKNKEQYIEALIQPRNEDSPARCPVRLFEFYVSKCPKKATEKDGNYYLLPEPSSIADSPVWFSASPLTREDITVIFNRIRTVREIQDIIAFDDQ